MSNGNTKLVYSTDRPVPRKKKPPKKVIQTNADPPHQKVIIRLDRKGRGGKSVTIIEGLQMSQGKKTSFLKQLKGKLGTGGTVRDALLEIQGDHCTAIMTELEKMGYKPKRSGV